MMDVEKYYTPEQMEYLRKRGEELGPEAIRSVEAEWPRLIQAMRTAMESGADPASPEVTALAKRWRELVEMFTGGDAPVTRSLGEFYKDRTEAGGGFMGIDSGLMAYVGRAMGGGDA